MLLLTLHVDVHECSCFWHMDRTCSTPGIVHLWGSPKDTGVTNFATILQYQEVAGNKAVLYVVDKPLTPTPPPPTAPPAPPKRG